MGLVMFGRRHVVCFHIFFQIVYLICYKLYTMPACYTVTAIYDSCIVCLKNTQFLHLLLNRETIVQILYFLAIVVVFFQESAAQTRIRQQLGIA